MPLSCRGRIRKEGRHDRAARNQRADRVAGCRPRRRVAAPGEPPERISLAVRLATLVAIIVPLLGLVAAPFFLWGWGFSWVDLGLLLGMYVLTALGITVGFHRLFTHRSFETYAWVKFVLAVLGSMAVQGPLLKWVALHRRHHQHSDTPDDPHSPHHHGGGVLGRARGASGTPTSAGCSSPTRRTSTATSRTCARAGPCGWRAPCSPLWVALGLVIPAVLGGLLTGTLGGRLDRADLGRAGPGLPGPPRDLERQLGLPPVGPAGPTGATTRAGTTSCSASWRWARGGTTPTTPSRPRPGTACGGGRST